jgi:hypothetical protein
LQHPPSCLRPIDGVDLDSATAAVERMAAEGAATGQTAVTSGQRSLKAAHCHADGTVSFAELVPVLALSRRVMDRGDLIRITQPPLHPHDDPG